MTQAVVRNAAPGPWLLALLLFLGGLLGPSVADAKPRKASTVSAKAGAKSAGAELMAALNEGRMAMREREAELRAEIARRTG